MTRKERDKLEAVQVNAELLLQAIDRGVGRAEMKTRIEDIMRGLRGLATGCYIPAVR